MNNSIGFPNISAPLVDKTGKISLAWLRFFQALYNRSGGAAGITGSPPITVTPTGSPYTFVAQESGYLMVSGGGVSDMTFTRDGINFYKVGQFYAPHPMQANDALVITYPFGAPKMVFVPG